MNAPAFLANPDTWGLVATFVALALAPGGLAALALMRPLLQGTEEQRSTARIAIGAVLASGAVGAALGISSAMSRTPVTDALIGGVLSLLGGVAVYFLGVKREGAGLVCVAVATLALTLLVGEIWGAAQRGDTEARRLCVEKLIDPATSRDAMPADSRAQLLAYCAPYFARDAAAPGGRAPN